MTDLTVLITGGAGFIGSALVRHLIRETPFTVVTVDKLTYSGNLESLEAVAADPAHHFELADICDAKSMSRIFQEYSPDAVFHLAAESHVDRSIDEPAAFIQTNIVGTYILLEAAARHWQALPLPRRSRFRFIHVSTDEVYGSLGDSGHFSEDTPYDPRSPYSASKASGDHLVRAWNHTYALPTVITNTCNNYGPYQYPEKLIPLAIQKALASEAIPIYGTGGNVRDWIYVEDHVLGLLAAWERGEVGESYNIGARSQTTNLDLIREVCSILDELAPSQAFGQYRSLITFVEDRPGHDWRYAIDPTKAEGALDWKPKESLSSGLRRTVRWYLENREWCRLVTEKEYAGQRLGLKTERP